MPKRQYGCEKKTLNLCARDNEKREHGEECEDVDIGWVRSREVTCALGTEGEPRNVTLRNTNVNSAQI